MIRPNRLVVSLASILSTALACTLISRAGPLDPPAGPVSPTYKTLDQVEPRIPINYTNTPGDSTSMYVITQRGSYYLTANLAGIAGKHGIRIAASNVTIDLCGYEVVGPGSGSSSGITFPPTGTFNDIAIRNGTLRGWGTSGIELNNIDSTNCRIESIIASGNGVAGIRLNVVGAVITGCAAGANTVNGFSFGEGVTAVNCVASRNSSHGFAGAEACSLTGCSATFNGGVGIVVGSACTLRDCTSQYNTQSGFSAGSGCTFTNCSASINTTFGFALNAGNVVNGCTAFANNSIGFSLGSGNTVMGCSARSNGLDGILAGAANILRANNCSQNGVSGTGAGIHTQGIDNRIEDNSCQISDTGIKIDATGSIIFRNTCTGNSTNWSIAAGNSVGPIVSAGSNASAINGNTAAGTLGSADPNANYTY